MDYRTFRLGEVRRSRVAGLLVAAFWAVTVTVAVAGADAVGAARQAAAKAEKAHGLRDARTAEALAELGRCQKAAGDYGRAERSYLRALRIYQAVLTPDHPRLGATLDALKGIYEDLFEAEKVEPLLRSHLKALEKHVGSSDPRLGDALRRLASCLAGRERWDEALALGQRAVDLAGQGLGRTKALDALALATALADLGRIHRLREAWPEAEACYARAVGVLGKSGDAGAEMKQLFEEQLKELRARSQGAGEPGDGAR